MVKKPKTKKQQLTVKNVDTHEKTEKDQFKKPKASKMSI